jgi:hypothetical protein
MIINHSLLVLSKTCGDETNVNPQARIRFRYLQNVKLDCFRYVSLFSVEPAQYLVRYQTSVSILLTNLHSMGHAIA